MRRIGLAVALALGLVLAPHAVDAQEVAKVWRIGYLSLATAEFDKSWFAAFQQGLRELGYLEGTNIIIERRHAAGQRERLRDLAAELVRLKVDVLVTYGGVPEARKATSTIPIVMTGHADPVGAGVVASLARPGGNVTGLSDFHGGNVTKRLELLKEAVPSASRVAVLLNPASPVLALQLKDVQAAAPALGMTVLSFDLRGPDDRERAFAAIGKARPGALLLLADSTFGEFRRTSELAIKYRLPAIATVREFADTGLLMAYGTNFAALWRRAATYVDKILKGANPGDLPVEQASKWDLVINLKTAKVLGLTIPQSVLIRADEIIQ